MLGFEAAFDDEGAAVDTSAAEEPTSGDAEAVVATGVADPAVAVVVGLMDI